MSQSAIVLLIVAIVVVAIAVAISAAVSRRSRLRGLPEESRDKYARSWRAVENRFIDDPTGAVNEADRMVVMMLSERGATLGDPNKVPDDLRKAREAAASDQGREGTEGMRMALLHYRRIVEDSIGDTRMKTEDYRREVAS